MSRPHTWPVEPGRESAMEEEPLQGFQLSHATDSSRRRGRPRKVRDSVSAPLRKKPHGRPPKYAGVQSCDQYQNVLESKLALKNPLRNGRVLYDRTVNRASNEGIAQRNTAADNEVIVTEDDRVPSQLAAAPLAGPHTSNVNTTTSGLLSLGAATNDQSTWIHPMTVSKAYPIVLQPQHRFSGPVPSMDPASTLSARPNTFMQGSQMCGQNLVQAPSDLRQSAALEKLKYSDFQHSIAIPARALAKSQDRPLPHGRYTKHDIASNILITLGIHPWLAPLNVRLSSALDKDRAGNLLTAEQQHQRGLYLQVRLDKMHKEHRKRTGALA